MQQQPPLDEGSVSLVVEIIGCSRETATSTLAAFGNDMERAIDWLSTHDGQPPPSSSSASADRDRIARLEAQLAGLHSGQSGLPADLNPDNVPPHILARMAMAGSGVSRSNDVSELINGTSSLAAIISINDASSRSRLELVLSEASRNSAATSVIAVLCCKYIRSIASSSSVVPIFEVNLILQFLAGSFSSHQQPSPESDDEDAPSIRSHRVGSAVASSQVNTADAILNSVDGLSASVLLDLLPRLCRPIVWGTHSILEDCASAAVGAVCYLVAVQLLLVRPDGILEVLPSAVGAVSDACYEMILRALAWLVKGRVHSATSLCLYLCACICCCHPSPSRLGPFVHFIRTLFSDDDSTDQCARVSHSSRPRSPSPPLGSQAETSIAAFIVPESVSSAIVAAIFLVFNYWLTDIQIHQLSHPELESCIGPILSLLLSVWKAALSTSTLNHSGARESLPDQATVPLTADEREEVDYAVVRQQRYSSGEYSTGDIAGMVQLQFHSIPNFHENYESLQAALGGELDILVRAFRDARLHRIRSLDSRLSNLLSRSDVAHVMKTAVQRRSHGFGFGSRADRSSPSDDICPKIITFLQIMLVGPSTLTRLLDPTQPETMPASVESILHPHTLEKRQSVYQTGRYTCDVCSSSGSGWVFHCQQCGWDAHPACIAGNFSELAQPHAGTPRTGTHVEDASLMKILQSCRAMFFHPKCAWLTCACDELTVAFSKSTSLAEKLKMFLCEVMNIVCDDGDSARYQILHSLTCATVKSQSQNVIWGLAGVLLNEISKEDVGSCFKHLIESREFDSDIQLNFATQLASSFSLLIIHITASLLEYATNFESAAVSTHPPSSFSGESEPIVMTRTNHVAFTKIAFNLVRCVQDLFELGVQGEIIPIDRVCRCFNVPGRYLAINRHVKSQKVSVIDALKIISAFSLKLVDMNPDSATLQDPHHDMLAGSCDPGLKRINAASQVIAARADPSDMSDWAVLKAVVNVLRLLATEELTVIKQECCKLEPSGETHVPFLTAFVQNNQSSAQRSIIAYCEDLLSACLFEIARILSVLDISTLTNDFIVSGLIEAMVLIVSNASKAKISADCQSFLPLAVRRRIFYKIMCETQKTVADPPSAFLRLIELLKRAVDDYDTHRSMYHGMMSAPSLRVILHDLSERCDPSLPPGQHALHGCECIFSKYDTQFLSKIPDALKYNDKRLLPRPNSFGYLPFGADRREAGFTQTLNFQDPQDWVPPQEASAVPARMWLCRRKCPFFNVEGRRMFVKEKGVIGCGYGSCGDDKKFDYSMCQACCISYKLQPPDLGTALEIFSSSSLNDAVLMLPHQSPTSNDPLVNRGGAVVKPGKRMVIYCGRKLGKDQIPGSNGVCGPSDGPQCADCAFSFPVDLAISSLFPDVTQLRPPNGFGSAPFGSVPFGQASRNSWQQPYTTASEVARAISQSHVQPSIVSPPTIPPSTVPPATAPDPAIIAQLVEQMGFSTNAATRAAIAVHSAGSADLVLAAAVDWLEMNSGDESINDPLPVPEPSPLLEPAMNTVAAPQQMSHSNDSVPPFGGGSILAPSYAAAPASLFGGVSVPAFSGGAVSFGSFAPLVGSGAPPSSSASSSDVHDEPSSPAYQPTSPPYTPVSPVFAPSLSPRTHAALNGLSLDDVPSSDNAIAQGPRISEPQAPSRPTPLPSLFHYSSSGLSTAANRTEFVIAFGSSLPDEVEKKDYVPRLRWSVQAVGTFMDTPSMSRTAVVSEIMGVKHEAALACRPIELTRVLRSLDADAPPFVLAHCLERHHILQWYSEVAAVVGTRQIVPKILCPASRPCHIVTFTGARTTCSICSHLIYLGSSVARSAVTDFIVCEACCGDRSVRERLISAKSADSASNEARSSNPASDLLELLVCPRAFIPAADNFAEDSWHKAMDMWVRCLCDILPSGSFSSAYRPRHLVDLETRVSNFRKRVSEPQFYFRVSGLDQTNVCEAMKQIFESRTKINLKLYDAQQGSIEHSKLTVLFQHKERAGQAAGMPASIHSDGITPVMYSILALEFSNPRKYAASMWLPSCCIDGEVAPCGLFPRPFIPDPSPAEFQLQRETVDRFLLLGRCIGIALRDRRVFMLPLSLAFADALCGKQLTLWDACIGEINLQETDKDGYSANRSLLHAIEHLHDVAFGMIFSGQTLSNQRVDVTISETSFIPSDDCPICNVPATVTVDELGGIVVDVTAEVIQYVRQLLGSNDPAYVTFSGSLPFGLSVCRAYKVRPVDDTSASRIKVCSHIEVSSPKHQKTQDFPVNMSVIRVRSNVNGAGDEYLRAVESYCLRSGIQMQIDAARRGIEEFVSLFRLEELCGDGLLEALGVTTNGERGISDEAWSHFVNNGIHTGAETDRDGVAPADMEIIRKALLLPLVSEANEINRKWPSMKQDFCRWVFGTPRLPLQARLKVVRTGRFFGHMCAPAELQIAPVQHAPPFVAPYRFHSPESRASHRDPVAALLECLEVYCKDGMHPGNPLIG